MKKEARLGHIMVPFISCFTQTLLETNLGRLQVELYKEIKKNGSPRCLRAAVWRFAEMAHLIRPQKCRWESTNPISKLSVASHFCIY